MSAALDVRGLRRGYAIALGLKRREVLRGIDLALERGGVLGLFGPNGSGKSTLLRCLAGVERARAERLVVLGASPQRSDVRRRIGYLPEESPFPRELSALSALALLGSLQRVPRALVRERSGELLELVGLTEHARRPLRSYSRGMLRRFGLAQAWLHEPELLLLDEPTAGLDAPGFEALEALLARARARGASIVLSSHLLSDLEHRCGSIAMLFDGRVAARGTPAELLGLPGRWRVELAGLDEDGLRELERWLAESGARLLEAHASGRTLLELYRDAARGP